MTSPDFAHGLVPAVVQDARTKAVLMVAFMNQEAWDRTLETRLAHFWSRSRNRLWRKGETSGNTLRVESWALDCDDDTVLLLVTPTGPACHRGTVSCFDPLPVTPADVLARLEDIIQQRAIERPDGSYTTELLDAGAEATGRKLVEEATEVLLAAKDHAEGNADDRRVAEEAADLMYHLLVALAERGLSLADVSDVLEERRSR